MLIETEELTYIYSPGTPWQCKALEGVSISWKPGDFAIIAGPSGSGKSTLIQHLNGLLIPSSGRVKVDGEELGSNRQTLKSIRRRLGLVFQIPEQQFFAETVFDEVGFAPRSFGLSPRQIARQVEISLGLVGLDYHQFRGCSPFNLSSGQQRLVALASVLALEPEVLVLDEPAAGLDSGGRKHLAGLLSKLHRQGGRTVILVTHRLEDFIGLADEILFLDGGRVVISGKVEEVLGDPVLGQRYPLFLPPVTDIMRRLSLENPGVDTQIYDLQSARKEIISWWRRSYD